MIMCRIRLVFAKGKNVSRVFREVLNLYNDVMMMDRLSRDDDDYRIQSKILDSRRFLFLHGIDFCGFLNTVFCRM